MNEERIHELAVMRGKAPAQRTPRLRADNPDYEDEMGYRAECAFNTAFGFPLDTKPHPRGDGGIDQEFFINGERFTIDVKNTKTNKLMVKNYMMPRCADYFVLYWEDDNKNVKAIGWATREDMENAPIDNDAPIPCHYLYFSQLRSMRLFVDLMGKRDTHE